MRLVLAAGLVVLAALGGCFGAQSRTQWAFTLTHLDDAAGTGRTGEGVTVAILDTGIDPGHVALKHLVDGDTANGELVAFKDYVNGRSGVGAAYDDEGHGTHVAGIIAAQGSSLSDKLQYNGVSLLGGAPHVKLVVAKVCPAKGACDGSALAPAIDWAVQSGARVVSLSLGGQGGRNLFGLNPSDVEQAIGRAVSQGVVVVAAAGNTCDPQHDADCASTCSDVEFPASIRMVIAVGAVGADGRATGFTCHGDDAGHACSGMPIIDRLNDARCDPDKKPELAAPGDMILSSWTAGQYVEASGTSQATPFVTAAVALMLQDHPALGSAQDVEALKAALESSASPSPGAARPHDEATGYGILDARAALRQFNQV